MRFEYIEEPPLRAVCAGVRGKRDDGERIDVAGQGRRRGGEADESIRAEARGRSVEAALKIHQYAGGQGEEAQKTGGDQLYVMIRSLTTRTPFDQ